MSLLEITAWGIKITDNIATRDGVITNKDHPPSTCEDYKL